MKTPKTPQQKKTLSYTKDHRKAPSANAPKARDVSAEKHRIERGARHREDQALRVAAASSPAADDLEVADGLVKEDMTHKRPIRRAPSASLTEAVEVKQRARVAKGMGLRKFSRLDPK
jgi:hypothetical protein